MNAAITQKAVKSFKLSNYLAKGVGYAGLGLVAYDAHKAGVMEASKFEKNHKAESLSHHFMEDMKLDSPSTVKSAIKKRLFHYHMDENLSGFFTSIKGYFKGLSSMLVDGIVPLSLAAGTVLMPKGFLSKTFGVGLLAYGGIFLLQEAFGIGKAKE